MGNKTPDDLERPTMELEAPRSQVGDGKAVEWVDSPNRNRKGYYKQPEKIDKEMQRIREILGDTKVLGVNDFPLTLLDKQSFPYDRNEVSLQDIEDSQKRVREMVREQSEFKKV